MSNKYSIILILIAINIVSCKIDTKKILKKQFYTSGKLKSSGWYIKDSIPVDTLYTFYETGSILGIDIFDSLGDYKKAMGYYEKGNMNEIINYENGLANGFRYLFYENGQVKSKVFYFNDLSVGDAFWYDKFGNITSYNFYDWKEHNINLIKYDNLGKIIKDFRQAIFLDSSKIHANLLTKDSISMYNLFVVISNPPHCKSVIKIDYLSKNNNVIKSDTLINKSCYLKSEVLDNNISKINILGSQYDSLKKKDMFQKKIINLIGKNN